jgi:DNA-binding transcriptional ArsR family regulator
MTDDGLDPVIHAPARLRLMVTLAALPEGDTLSFTRLQDLIGLTPGNLITHLRKLDDAGYVQTDKTGSGVNALTTVALTHHGRAALQRYTAALRQLLDTAEPNPGGDRHPGLTRHTGPPVEHSARPPATQANHTSQEQHPGHNPGV